MSELEQLIGPRHFKYEEYRPEAALSNLSGIFPDIFLLKADNSIKDFVAKSIINRISFNTPMGDLFYLQSVGEQQNEMVLRLQGQGNALNLKLSLKNNFEESGKNYPLDKVVDWIFTSDVSDQSFCGSFSHGNRGIIPYAVDLKKGLVGLHFTRGYCNDLRESVHIFSLGSQTSVREFLTVRAGKSDARILISIPPVIAGNNIEWNIKYPNRIENAQLVNSHINSSNLSLSKLGFIKFSYPIRVGLPELAKGQ